MTSSQTKLYWRKWAKVRKALVDLGEFSCAEADEERHKIHIAALGADKSSKTLSNRDLDAVFDHFDKYLVIIQGPTVGPPRSQIGGIKRLVFAVESLGLEEPYLQSIARDQFQSSDWRQLSETQLAKFRFTATARARQRSKPSR